MQWVHVYGRTVEKRLRPLANPRLADDFLWRLRYGLDDHDVACGAFGLMPNHYHLLLRERAGSISAVMHGLLMPFAKQINRELGRSGKVFEKPFGSRPVTGPRDLIGVVAYIHLNPFELPFSMPSSDGIYRGLEPRPLWLDCERVIERFGGHEGYINYMTGAEAMRDARRLAPMIDD